jgi:VWFA-related protein
MRNVKMGNLIKKSSITFAAMFGLVLGPVPASAQDANSSTDVPVHMVVTVKPHRGAQVPALAADDVEVYQKGKPDMVASWVPLQGDRAGLQLFILIDDTSRSSLALQYRDIDKFIEAQPATTAIGVGYMRNGTVFTAQNLTTEHALAEKALRLPIGASAGYNSPYLALSDLMKKWPETKDRREIVMITSGVDPLGGGFSNDPFTNPYLDAAFERAQRGGFIVYSIYSPGAGRAGRGLFRTNLAQSGLDLLAQKTGGETYYLGLGAPVDITPYLRDISNNLKNQYALTFLAKGAKKPVLEPVKVKTEMPNTGLVTAEDGYIGSGM